MVRAELGAGNRDAAVDLLERLKTRLVWYSHSGKYSLIIPPSEVIQRLSITVSVES